jgi:tetratricopeptide (TPR) repeat protein
MDELAQGSKPEALVQARQWAKTSPDDALAFVALGEAAEANQSPALAARAYGSLFELWSYRADMRRFAGERLDRLAHPEALDLAIDTYRKAVADRPDNPGGHRLLAYALARRGRYADAFAAISAGLGRVRDDRLYRGVNEILRADAGVLAAAWERAEPWHGVELADKTRALGVDIERTPTLRFVLSWETDANDVDLHVWDGARHHAYYGAPSLASGGHLFADVTTGYGPEELVVPLDRPHDSAPWPYELGVHYYARGAMGFGMGKLEIVEHDGHGKLSFEERPYVVMTDRSGLDLGAYVPKVRPTEAL